MAENKNEELDTYIIPPNFIESGTIFGGTFKVRNVVEAGMIVTLIGLPVLKMSLSLTIKVMILCFTALPLGILALIGVSGESLSSFIVNYIRFVKNRRIIGEVEEDDKKTTHNKFFEKKRAQKKHVQSTAEYLPIEKIENGIIYTKDDRYF